MIDKTHPIHLCRENNIPRDSWSRRVAIEPLSVKNNKFLVLILNNTGINWLGRDAPVIIPDISLSITWELKIKRARNNWYRSEGYYIFSFGNFINSFLVLKNGEWGVKIDRIKYALGIE